MGCLNTGLVALLALGPTLWIGDDSGDKQRRTVREQLDEIAKKYSATTPGEQYQARSREHDAAREREELSLPDDPMLAEQWYLFPPGDERSSPGSSSAIEAWRHIRPVKPIVVALLDGGLNYTHPDLAANIWKNEREMPNGKDDDNNGYVDDMFGWDFAYANNNPISRRSLKFPDQFDHGTALASLMAAVPDNRIGTSGVGRNVKIMNLRVAGDPDFEGQDSIPLTTTLPQAIRYAIRNGASVIVCTIGSLDPPERHFGTSLKEAENAGVLFVKSADNHGRDIDDDPLFQFLAQYSNVLVVGGTTRDGTLSPHMNFGKRVGIAAHAWTWCFRRSTATRGSRARAQASPHRSSQPSRPPSCPRSPI